MCFILVVWTYQAEIFPLRIRAKGTGLGTMANWIGNTIIAYGFPVVDEALNHQPSFYFIFASTSIAMGIWAYFAISETKGKTLEEIDAVFGDNLAVAEIEAQQAGIVFNKAVGGH
jgi:hypothetical protein